MKLAAIDIGSNSIHLIVVQISRDGAATLLAKSKEMVGLASHTLANGVLSETAFTRGMECMERFAKIIQAHGVDAVEATATSAVREASNGPDFIAQVEARCGIKARIIPGEEEARLIYLGARDHIDWSHGERVLIVDIGGGSVEFIVADRHRAYVLESRKLGVRRMGEEFIHHDPPTPGELRALRLHVHTELRALLRVIGAHDFDFIVGSSGTLNTLALMAARAEGVDVPSSHGVVVRREAVTALLREAVARDAQARATMPGLDARRVDTFIPGALVMRELLGLTRRDRYIACDYALREGLVVDYAERHLHGPREEPPPANLRQRSALRLFQRFNVLGPHPRQVSRLALALFDQLAPLHDLPPDLRELLEYAALLHDIGHAISRSKHHKHSAYLIQHGDLQGFTTREIALMAATARYHRNARPKPSHDLYKALSPDDRAHVEALSALLRLANALDASRTNAVTELRCDLTLEPLHLQLDVFARTDADLELWSAEHVATTFADVFECALDVTAHPARVADSSRLVGS